MEDLINSVASEIETRKKSKEFEYSLNDEDEIVESHYVEPPIAQLKSKRKVKKEPTQVKIDLDEPEIEQKESSDPEESSEQEEAKYSGVAEDSESGNDESTGEVESDDSSDDSNADTYVAGFDD